VIERHRSVHCRADIYIGIKCKKYSFSIAALIVLKLNSQPCSTVFLISLRDSKGLEFFFGTLSANRSLLHLPLHLPRDPKSEHQYYRYCPSDICEIWFERHPVDNCMEPNVGCRG
jgi:hypothetical protein